MLKRHQVGEALSCSLTEVFVNKTSADSFHIVCCTSGQFCIV